MRTCSLCPLPCRGMLYVVLRSLFLISFVHSESHLEFIIVIAEGVATDLQALLQGEEAKLRRDVTAQPGS